jgi:outer membrane protein OmpA-like peptidoglycan-associated protein
MEGGKTANYWPGFVDALTNVVIAMVFVIVVLAIALSFSAQLLAKRMAARITVLEQQGKATQAQTAASAPELIVKRLAPSAQLSNDPSPNTSIEAADDTQRVESKMAAPIRINVKGNEEKLVAAGGKMQPSDRYMLLEFAPTALTLDEAASKSLGASLDKLKQQLASAPPGAKVVLVASGPDIELSENQRAGYIRAMAVRNELLEQGFAAERIATRFDLKAKPTKATISMRIEGSSP